MRRRRAFWISMAVLLAVVVVAVAIPVVLLASSSSSGDRPEDVAGRYLAAWQRHDWAAMRKLVQSPPATFTATYEGMERGLDVTRARYAKRAVTTTGDLATVGFHADVTLSEVGPYAYDGELRLSRASDKHWLVTWSPAAVHPQLTSDGRFTVTRVVHPRADILAADGTPLTAGVIVVGVEPQRVKDRASLLTALQQYAGANPAGVAQALDQPGLRPDAFVPVARLTDAQYEAVRPQLYPIPGTVFRSQGRQGVTPDLAAHVVGAVGPITAELLHQLGPPYTATDLVGLRGLERTFERRLAGTPDAVAEIVRAGNAPPVVLARRAGVAPQSVRTTIDLGVQRAAETTLAGGNHAALVVVRPSTGAILAVVSTPATEEFDRALDGRYPPGSTFKIVTSAALLGSGVPATQPTTCPATLPVGGRTFTNFEGESRPSLTFAQAFTISCNTAFIKLGSRLSDDQLAHTAQTFGFGAKFDLGVAATSGSFPAPAGAVDHAASVIGQAKVTASPLEMTTVAAAVQAGTWRAPTLLIDPAPATPPATHALDPNVVSALQSFMHDVVASSDGTGTAARLPGTPVAGKTGTAEFGTGNPPAEHAWFVGYRGDLAFGVLVEGGGVGGRVAAPLAAKLLTALG
jgi:cell division protein FtsI/penicillin-binding protein 2